MTDIFDSLRRPADRSSVFNCEVNYYAVNADDMKWAEEKLHRPFRPGEELVFKDTKGIEDMIERGVFIEIMIEKRRPQDFNARSRRRRMGQRRRR